MNRIMRIDEYNQSRMFKEYPSGMTVGELVLTLKEDYADLLSTEYMKKNACTLNIISKEDYDKSKKWQADYPCIPCDTILCDHYRDIYILSNRKSDQYDMYDHIDVKDIDDIVKGLEGVSQDSLVYAEYDYPEELNRVVCKISINMETDGDRCKIMFVAAEDERYTD